MSKWMRRWSWLALLMWLGCGESSMDAAQSSTADTFEGSGDGEILGAAASGEERAGAAEGHSDVAASMVSGAGGAAAPTTSAVTATSAPGAGSSPGTSGASTPAGESSAADPSPSAGPSVSTGESAASAPMMAASGAAGAGAEAAAPPADADSSASDPMSGRDDATRPAEDPGQVPASVLTAGTWDDNLNYDRFDAYRKSLAEQQLNGMLPSTDAEHDSAHQTFAQPGGPREKLDVALVIDTTGSMGDEIRYLQSEFLALSAAIEAKYPNAQQRWSLVLYRDMGDEYVTRWFDFREDAMEFRDKLAMQSAAGGGDFPEAPDAALEAMAQLAWRSDDGVARLAFWVADAPHHNDKAQAMLESIRAARELGIHLYPVASSGVDELTELTMRSSAQLTGGRYLFLTDDSGIGGSHKEPTIPCYFVTKLDSAILRMVDIEMTGVYAEPSAEEIIRTSGDPKDGSCELSSGEVVEAF